MIIDFTQPKERTNWVAAQAACCSCDTIHDIMQFATNESFNGDCDVCGEYVCTIVYGKPQGRAMIWSTGRECDDN